MREAVGIFVLGSLATGLVDKEVGNELFWNFNLLGVRDTLWPF
jgi:hypothetical protein